MSPNWPTRFSHGNVGGAEWYPQVDGVKLRANRILRMLIPEMNLKSPC